VVWVRAHARQFKVDPQRIALLGESAGGHLVSFAGARAKASTRVAAVVSFYGPHDFAARAEQHGRLAESLKAFLGLAELNDAAQRSMREASPITYVHKDMPPYLLIHGTADSTVPYDQSVRMCDRMKQAGASCEIFAVQGAPHGVGPWEKTPEFQGYKGKMVEWLGQTLGAGQAAAR